MSVAERVEALARRYALPAQAGPRLVELLDVVADDPHAPTSVTTREQAVGVHLADSLSALELAPVRNAERVADIGSGAGFPGLVLAIALADAHVALVESVGRKCEFLERARRAIGADNVSVVRLRAEAWLEGIGQHDLVTIRAVGPLAVLCEYAAPLLREGGSMVAWKGTAADAERMAGDRAAHELGLEPAGVVRTAPYPGSAHHHLHVYAKVSKTPPRFPRRPGAARKHPLGGGR